MRRDIRVRAFPGAKKELVIEEGVGKLKIFVREPAQNNLANRRIIQLVAEYAGVEISAVSMRTGHRSFNKLFEIQQ